MRLFSVKVNARMPRQPDPDLEARTVDAALRLLDRGGEALITMRAVAAEAGTTTPTIYERFPDRERLMAALVDHITREMVKVIGPRASVEGTVREFLRYAEAHPMRIPLSISTFGRRLVGGEEMPAYGLLKARISAELGVRGRACEDAALAITSLAFGTALGIITAGGGTRHAAELRRSAMHALRRLLGAFSAGDVRRRKSANG